MQDGGGRHLENRKNSHISAAVRTISTKFGMMMQFNPIERLNRQKFEISKIQDGGGRHLEKFKIAITRPTFDWFWRNLARWCISSLLTVPTQKFKILQLQSAAGILTL